MIRPTPPAPDLDSQGDYGDAFPRSRRIQAEGNNGIHGPWRECRLSGGEPSLRVYDTGGPRDGDVRVGLPKLREEWIRARGDVVETGRHALPPFARDGRHGNAEIPETLNHTVLRGTG